MIGIVANLQKAGILAGRDPLAEELNKRGIIYRTYETAAEMGTDAEQLECVISVGGDGSLLRCAEYSVKADVPVFGINLGRVGFLTEVRADRIPEAVDRYLAHDYTEERRLMLHCKVNGETVRHCLNDVLVSRSSFSGLTSMDMLVDGDRIGPIFCDGMLAATPTGSTGYTLSAGGPVLYDGVDGIAVTPVCSHSVYIRPFVVRSDSELIFEMRDSGIVCIDGAQMMHIGPGDTVSVTRSEYTFRMIRFEHTNVAGLIREKLC